MRQAITTFENMPYGHHKAYPKLPKRLMQRLLAYRQNSYGWWKQFPLSQEQMLDKQLIRPGQFCGDI